MSNIIKNDKDLLISDNQIDSFTIIVQDTPDNVSLKVDKNEIVNNFVQKDYGIESIKLGFRASIKSNMPLNNTDYQFNLKYLTDKTQSNLLPGYKSQLLMHVTENCVLCKNEGKYDFKNDDKFDAKNDIKTITLDDLIYKLAHDFEQNSNIFTIVLYTYRMYITERQLFQKLIERFKVQIPINLTESEKNQFLENVISKVQIKILLFIKFWFRLYGYQLLNDKKLEELFTELLYIIFTHKNAGRWIFLPLSQIFTEWDNLEYQEKNMKTHFVIPTLNSKAGNSSLGKPLPSKINFPSSMHLISLPEYFVPLPLILQYSHLLAKQFCLFDVENYKKLKLHELYDKNWTKANKYELSPNITYIIEMTNRISRLISYFILMNRQNKFRIVLYQYLIDLCHQLLEFHNFNTSYAVYAGLTCGPIDRLKRMIEEKLLNEQPPRDYKSKLERLKSIFSTKNNLHNLRNIQDSAVLPCIPYLGVYLHELFFLDDAYQTYADDDNYHLNYAKLKQIAENYNRIFNFKESKYHFHRADVIMNYIKGIPAISEELIYDLSYKILPD